MLKNESGCTSSQGRRAKGQLTMECEFAEIPVKAHMGQ